MLSVLLRVVQMSHHYTIPYSIATNNRRTIISYLIVTLHQRVLICTCIIHARKATINKRLLITAHRTITRRTTQKRVTHDESIRGCLMKSLSLRGQFVRQQPENGARHERNKLDPRQRQNRLPLITSLSQPLSPHVNGARERGRERPSVKLLRATLTKSWTLVFASRVSLHIRTVSGISFGEANF